jgi:hypothetical protein
MQVKHVIEGMARCPSMPHGNKDVMVVEVVVVLRREVFYG